jgi:ABC-type uncharacterized transport system permease subunit
VWPPPLLGQRPLAAQVFLLVVLPVVFGAVCGAVLGASKLWFNVLMLVAGIGGIGGGFEHTSARSGLFRGILAGALFAGALLVTFEVRGVPALTPLPAALPIMAVVYAVMGMPFGALGGWLRARSNDRRARAAANR